MFVCFHSESSKSCFAVASPWNLTEHISGAQSPHVYTAQRSVQMLLLFKPRHGTLSSSCFNPHLRMCLLILEREGGKETGGGREKEKYRCEKHLLGASCMCPERGSNLRPRYVPWPGIEPSSTFWFTGGRSTPLSHPARATRVLLKKQRASINYARSAREKQTVVLNKTTATVCLVRRKMRPYKR